MILIESIKWYEVEGNVIQFAHCEDPSEPLWLADRGEDIVPVEAEIVHEVINGRHFRRRGDGTDVWIGMAADPANLLGLQYEAFDTLEDMYRKQAHFTKLAEAATRRLQNAGFFTRIKWVFTGVK